MFPVGFGISCRAGACRALRNAVGFQENMWAVGRRASSSVGRTWFVSLWRESMQKPCRNFSVGNPCLPGSSGLGGSAMRSGPCQGCRVLDTVGSVGEKSMSGQHFKRCRGWLPVGSLSGIVGCRGLLRQETCATDHIRISWYQTVSRRWKTLLATQHLALKRLEDQQRRVAMLFR